MNAPNIVPVKAGDLEAPAALVEATASLNGLGITLDSSDLRLQLRLLQSNSPYVNARGDMHVPGADAGHWLLLDAPQPVISGETGIPVLVCGMVSTLSEFLRDRGGFVERHLTPPSDMIEHRDEGARFPTRIRKESGNVLIATKEVYVYVLGMGLPAVYYASSTALRFVSRLMLWLSQYTNKKTGGPMPSFARHLLFKSAMTSNAKGSWFLPTFSDEGWQPIDADFQAISPATAKSNLLIATKAPTPRAGAKAV
jgi:hypothetical protein